MPEDNPINASSHIVQEQSEAVAATNLKVGGEIPAYMMALAYQQALDAAVGWRTINQATVGKMSEQVIMTSPTQGGVDTAALQMLLKGAQTTPPVTAPLPVT